MNKFPADLESFSNGDLVIYRPSRRRYVVVKFYKIKHDGDTIYLVDVKPAEKRAGDNLRDFRGHNAAYFDAVDRK